MRAVVVREPRKIDIVDAPLPAPLASQLLVRLEGCGVCASNIPAWEGKPWFDYPMQPGALGHEAWGRVEELGSSVTGFAAGDRVAILSYNGYAEFDVCEASAAVKLPNELDAQPFPGEPLGCAMNIFNRCNIDIDDTVAIVGVGFLGALLTQLASATGARVIAISRSEFALRHARDMGAAATLLLEDSGAVASYVKRLTSGDLCDVVIEATGKQAPLDLAAQLTRERGRLVIAGYHQDGPRKIDMQLWNWRGLDVINAHERDPQIYVEGMRQAVRSVASGFLNPAPLYTHEFPLVRLAEAFNTAAERPHGFMKALVMMQ
jgi:2-desacetyl-2-hydroxyethyl bacteriochlorophyllide A dehydrogenase